MAPAASSPAECRTHLYRAAMMQTVPASTCILYISMWARAKTNNSGPASSEQVKFADRLINCSVNDLIPSGG
jgi:hypothetical protein